MLVVWSDYQPMLNSIADRVSPRICTEQLNSPDIKTASFRRSRSENTTDEYTEREIGMQAAKRPERKHSGTNQLMQNFPCISSLFS